MNPDRSVPLDTRPELRADVVHAAAADGGALIRSSDGEFVLKGPSVHGWLTALWPFLNGELTIRELCRGFTDRQRDTAERLIAALLELGLARDAGDTDQRVAVASARKYFGAQLDCIAQHRGSPARRFERYRTGKVLLIGSGLIAQNAAAGLLRNGLQTLHVEASDAGSARLVKALREVRAELSAHGVATEIRPMSRAVRQDSEYDVVVAVEDGTCATRFFEAVTRSRSPAVVPLLTADGLALIGPVAGGSGQGLWLSALRHFERNRGLGTLASFWRSVAATGPRVDQTRLTDRASRVLGGALAREVFRILTGCARPETDGAVIVHDLTTLNTWSEQVLPHPASSGNAVGKWPVPSIGAEPVDADVSESGGDAAPLVQQHVGILQGFDDVIGQAPLWVARVRLGRSAAEPRRVTAVDVESNRAARRNAIKSALLVYADRVDRVPPVGSASAFARTVPPSALDIWSGPLDCGDGLLLPARSLSTDDVVGVAWEAVFPLQSEKCHGFDRTAAGGGCGGSMGEAVHSALLSAFSYRALRAALAGAPAEPVASESPWQDDVTVYLRGALRRMGSAVELLVLTREPFPVILARVPDDRADDLIWTVAASDSPTAAVNNALRDLLGAVQMGREGWEYDPGDPLMTEFDPRAVRVRAAVSAEAAAGIGGTVGEYLRSGGEDAYLVDTTPSDLAATGQFVTVKALLAAGLTSGG
ncbi:hypothetical protein [Amycolatopsis sp. NPDC004079]|uniref:hypothetical protein n=1 Tax=Amycolatopsis sp. NPDC004079 TaxID=3154549 RepID=UPI0033BE3DB1